ncbi:hypothetical protein B0H13DRAFT_1863865 [Mycena leptocephala]|nr:hypothetical protein B0H13DRAFT_1863865 [Mycena leptocephala]
MGTNPITLFVLVLLNTVEEPLAGSQPDRRRIWMGQRGDSDARGTPQRHPHPPAGSRVLPHLRDGNFEGRVPPLPAPAPATVTKPCAKASKANKGKGKAKAAPTTPEAHTSDNDDPFLAAATVHAVAASLSLPTPMDHTMEGASPSRRPAAGAGSPSKWMRLNTGGKAAPTPYAAVAAMPTVNAAVAPVAVPAIAPIAMPVITPVTVPVVAPIAAAPTPAPTPLIAVAADAMLVLWLTADGLPPHGSYTPTPPGGYPDIVYSMVIGHAPGHA